MTARQLRVMADVAAGSVILGALGVVHVVLARHLSVPVIYGDELGYIENARYLVFGGAHPARTYYPGLSLLLVPVWSATQHALTVWRGAQLINGAAALVTAVEAVVLAGVCGLRAPTRWLVALAASAYPPVLLYSDLALSESLFTALFLGLVLVVAVAGARTTEPRGGTALWGLAGLGAVAATVAHPRGFAVDVAVVLLAAVVLRPVRSHVTRWLALAIGMTLGFALLQLALVATRAANVGGRLDYEANGVVGRNLNLHALAGLTSGIVGRLFYLSVATAGLVPLALATGAAATFSVVVGDRRPAQIARSFTAVSAVVVMGLSVLLVNEGSRADQLLHGRYVDGVVAPLIVVALADLVVSRGRLWLAWAVTGIGTVAVTGGLLAGTHSFVSLTDPINAVNILGIEPLVRRLSANDVKVLPLVLLAAGAIAVLSVTAIRLPRLAAAVLMVAFACSAIDTQVNYLEPGSAAKSRQTVLVDTIETASAQLGAPRSCVAYDGELDFNYFADRLLLGSQPLGFLNVGDRPCGPFVITARPAFEQRFPGARLVIGEDDVSESLYVLAGPTQDLLAAAGWLQPDPAPGPLPVAGELARISVPPDAVLVVPSGATDVISSRVTNAAHLSTWAAPVGSKQAVYAVRMAERWFVPGQTPSDPGGPGDDPAAVSIVDFPRSILPGQTITVPVPLVARALDGTPLPPGEYRVRLAVYQESVAAYPGGITLDVLVGPARPGTPVHLPTTSTVPTTTGT